MPKRGSKVEDKDLKKFVIPMKRYDCPQCGSVGEKCENPYCPNDKGEGYIAKHQTSRTKDLQV